MKDNTLSTITTQFLLSDLKRWTVQQLNKVDASRAAKPPEVYFDRGRTSAFREVLSLITTTLTTNGSEK